MHDIEPWRYLRDLFCLMPIWPRSGVLELAPEHWRQTLERPDVQQHLDANVYRRATLFRAIRLPDRATVWRVQLPSATTNAFLSTTG